MTITQNIPDEVYMSMDETHFKAINEYIDDPHTATIINDCRINMNGNTTHPYNKEFITNELVYYWMIECNIPINVCEKWNFNRLLTLIRVCHIKNPSKENKMSKR